VSAAEIDDVGVVVVVVEAGSDVDSGVGVGASVGAGVGTGVGGSVALGDGVAKPVHKLADAFAVRESPNLTRTENPELGTLSSPIPASWNEPEYARKASSHEQSRCVWCRKRPNEEFFPGCALHG
jgi:hypothetical protein